MTVPTPGIFESDVAIASQVSAQSPQLKSVERLIAQRVVYFEENQGQFDSKVRYLARGTNGYDLFLTATDAVYVLKDRRLQRESRNVRGGGLIDPIQDPDPTTDGTKAVAVFMSLSGANPEAVSSGFEQLGHHTNYFKGEESNWRTNIPNYGQVRMSDVYDGIDTVWNGLDGGGVQYDFVVEPFADPNQIRWKVEGAESVELDAEGNLIIKTEYGEIRQNKPFTFQETEGLRHEVQSQFVIEESEVSFDVGDYDRSKILTIDPTVNLSTLEFSTFLGGAGPDSGNAITLDGAGNIYVTGESDSTSFPTTAGAYDRTHNGVWDVFVTKLNATGSGLIYSTFIGGSDTDIGHDIAVDSSGSVFVTGATVDAVTNYPTTAGAYDTTHNGSSDVFVTKLNATGSGLIYSTFIGGSGSENSLSVALDSSGSVIITGTTFDATTDYPTTAGAYDTTHNGSNDVFVTKLNATGSGLIYSTFIGGSDTDVGYDVAVDSSGSVYVTGTTVDATTDYPTTAGAYDTTHNGSNDVFVTKLNATASGLIYSTFIGGSDIDYSYGIAVDSSGSVYVTGTTVDGAIDYPTTSGAYDTTHNGSDDVFVTLV